LMCRSKPAVAPIFYNDLEAEGAGRRVSVAHRKTRRF
jgi:hypothetical protein